MVVPPGEQMSRKEAIRQYAGKGNGSVNVFFMLVKGGFS
jgi:hypothetical protein